MYVRVHEVNVAMYCISIHSHMVLVEEREVKVVELNRTDVPMGT